MLGHAAVCVVIDQHLVLAVVKWKPKGLHNDVPAVTAAWRSQHRQSSQHLQERQCCRTASWLFVMSGPTPQFRGFSCTSHNAYSWRHSHTFACSMLRPCTPCAAIVQRHPERATNFSPTFFSRNSAHKDTPATLTTW